MGDAYPQRLRPQKDTSKLGVRNLYTAEEMLSTDSSHLPLKQIPLFHRRDFVQEAEWDPPIRDR